ncbi:MAG: ABC transporter ATP-binding protein [Lachnospiraceae bacterium]
MKGNKLTLQNIRHVYGGDERKGTEAIHHIDLEVRDGEFLAIVGASGCGKSTLLNIMCGMIQATQGEVMIDQEPVSSRKHKIGYISQSDTLLPWRRIEANVALGLEIEGVPKKERLERARRMLEISGLSGFEKRFPFELSGGMRKRAVIVRALVQNPDIIFMDEPFGPLDVFTRETLQKEILKIWRERKNTIVYITHDIAEAITMADRIILLSKRPSVIKSEYIVDIERPRIIEECKYDPRFLELERQIWNDIKDELCEEGMG